MNPPISPDPFADGIPDIVVIFKVIIPFVLIQIASECLGGDRFIGVVVTPHFVDGVEILGGDL